MDLSDKRKIHDGKYIDVYVDSDAEIITIIRKETSKIAVAIWPKEPKRPFSLVVAPVEDSEMVVSDGEAGPAVRIVERR